MAYYAFSAFDANVGEARLSCARVSTRNVERAIASIDEESAHGARRVTPDELADYKQFLIGSMPRTLETNAGIASFLQSAEFFGLGLDYDLRLPGLLDARDARRGPRRRAALLHPDRAALVVAGPHQR